MRYTYKTQNTCSTSITFDLEGDIVRSIQFTGGCHGNLQAIQKLTEGFTVEKIVTMLGGNTCGARPTSCADQLAVAVERAYQEAQR